MGIYESHYGLKQFILENILQTPNHKTPPYELFHKKKATIIPYLHQLREMCTVAKRNKIKDKLSDDRGFIAMMVVYAEDHTNGTYQFYNFKTKRVFLSRDIVWHNKLFSRTLSPDLIIDYFDNDFMDIEIIEQEGTDNNKENENAPVPTEQTQSKRITRSSTQQLNLADVGTLPRAARKLIDSLHPMYESGTLVYMGSVNSGYIEPQNCKEAINSENAKEWQEAMDKEIGDMHSRSLWSVVDRSTVPENRRLLECRWVF
jgi:hypothetical protein